ncbi:MAG TPA: hypothetical protein V6D19_14570 [Stenomitos sp.]
MFKPNFCEVLAVLIVSIQLLSQANQAMVLNKWLTPFSLGWLLAGLTWFMPHVQRGSWFAAAISYVLVSGLIFNTLVLFVCSKLPNCIVELKSPIVETIGTVLLASLGTGIFLSLTHGMKLLKRGVITGLQLVRGQIAQPSAA